MRIHFPLLPRRKAVSSFIALATLLSMGVTSMAAQPLGGSATDFTFIVPINLRNLHESVRSVFVFCEVKHSGGGGVGRFNTLGGGGLHLPVNANGSISRTETIRITVEPNSRQYLGMASEWQCTVAASASMPSGSQRAPADTVEFRVNTTATNFYALRAGSPLSNGALIARGTF